MQPVALAKLLVGSGLLLLVVSFILPWLVGGERSWTDDMAKQYSIASANYHDALHARAHRRDGHAHVHADSAAGLEATREAFMQQQEKLSAAQSKGRLSASVMRCLGVVSAAIGVVIFLVKKPEAF